jgi:aldehyde:ferredoxin oxidoreductase
VIRPLINWLNLCYKEGILSDSGTGLPLSKIGSIEFFETLIKKISYREGFGDLLAQGSIKAAEYVGKGSQKLLGRGGIGTRADESVDYDPRLILTNAMIYATEPRRPIQTLHEISNLLREWVNWCKGQENATVSTEIFQRIAEKYWGSKAAADFSTYEGKALAAKKIQDYQYAKESMILCDIPWPNYKIYITDSNISPGTIESQIVSSITGRDIDEAGLAKMGERVFNLQRMILLKEGWGGRKGDTLLDHFFEEPLESVYWSTDCVVPGKDGRVTSRKGMVIDRVKFEIMKSEYFAARHWDIDTGVPTEDKLKELGLKDIIP